LLLDELPRRSSSTFFESFKPFDGDIQTPEGSVRGSFISIAMPVRAARHGQIQLFRQP